jgi:predicted Zn-dependent protease with MMP-like domain
VLEVGLTGNQRRVLDELLDEAAAFADAGQRDKARRSLDAATKIAPSDPDVVFERLRWRVLDGDTDGARRALEELVADAPDHGDARHLLGELQMQAGERAAAIAQWSEVLRLDQARSARSAAGAEDDVAWIEQRAQEVLDGLPEPFASRLQDIPVVLEARPHAAVVADGFDPRALGLFEGPLGGREESEHLALATSRIVLFWANLLESTRDDDELAAEIETTLLHEIGHVFGLDEDEVDALGLG